MKKFVTASTRIGMLVLLSVAALAASAKAQGGSGLRANIPFDFTVAGKSFAAGHYSITRASQTSGDLVLEVNSLDENSRALPITSRLQTLKPRDQSVVIFHRYGEEYFLAQVWAAGSTTGRAFARSRRERQLQQQRVGATDRKAVTGETVALVF